MKLFMYSSVKVCYHDLSSSHKQALMRHLFDIDDLSSDTKLDIRVWDADKIKYDDMWGSYSIAVRDILQSKLDRLGNVIDYCKEERVVYDGYV